MKDLNLYKDFPNKKVVLLQSGGLDSCVCDAFLDDAGFEVTELFIDYGQSALSNERQCAENLADYYKHPLVTAKIDLPWWKELPIVGGVVKSDGSYSRDHETVDPESYIPLRNHIFIGTAFSLAEKLGYPYICVAVDGQQDKHRKPIGDMVDAHAEFIRTIEVSLNEGSAIKHKGKSKITILAPLLGMNKRDIVNLGLKVNAPFEYSWSCYNGGVEPCCSCSSCIGREDAFRRIGLKDPLLVSLGIEYKNILPNLNKKL